MSNSRNGAKRPVSAPDREPLRSVITRTRRLLVARLDRKSQLGTGLTASVIVSGLAIWALRGFLDAILDNDALVRWDALVEDWFHVHATPTGLAVFNAVTELGSPGVAVVTTAVAIYLWRTRVFPAALDLARRHPRRRLD